MRSQTSVTIRSVRRPVTGRRIARDLRRLGVKPGQTLLVHASLRSLGWVTGGAPTVVSALRQAVGPDGHVVALTATEANSQTSRAHRAHIETMTPEEVRAFRRDMPAFDQDRTLSGMGAISEAVRTTDGAVRSAHPQTSFAAIGPQADLLMADHPLECHLGPDSPLGRLEKMDAQVLMIEVGYWAFTGFHLAEYRYTLTPPTRKYACVLAGVDGVKQWAEYEDVVLDDQKFEHIGEALENKVNVRHGKVGQANCRLVPLHAAVEFAAEWLARDRDLSKSHLRLI